MSTFWTAMKNLSYAALVITMTGCNWNIFQLGKKSTEDRPTPLLSPPPQPAPSSNPTKPTGKSNQDRLREVYNKSRADQEEKLAIFDVERHFQRVIRKDCNGAITSDKEETVKYGRFDIRLNSPRFLKQYKSVFVFNDKTGDDYLAQLPLRDWFAIGELYAVTSSGRGEIKIKADLADATFTFHVENGLNNLFAEFHYDCAVEKIPYAYRIYGKAKADQICKQSNDKVLVHYPIQVNYTEKHLGGFQEILPRRGDCR